MKSKRNHKRIEIRLIFTCRIIIKQADEGREFHNTERFQEPRCLPVSEKHLTSGIWVVDGANHPLRPCACISVWQVVGPPRDAHGDAPPVLGRRSGRWEPPLECLEPARPSTTLPRRFTSHAGIGHADTTGEGMVATHSHHVEPRGGHVVELACEVVAALFTAYAMECGPINSLSAETPCFYVRVVRTC